MSVNGELGHIAWDEAVFLEVKRWTVILPHDCPGADCDSGDLKHQPRRAARGSPVYAEAR